MERVRTEEVFIRKFGSPGRGRSPGGPIVMPVEGDLCRRCLAPGRAMLVLAMAKNGRDAAVISRGYESYEHVKRPRWLGRVRARRAAGKCVA